MKLKGTSCSLSFSAMYFLAASVASFTCVSRAAWDAISFANWVRRVTVRLNTLVKKNSEQNCNLQDTNNKKTQTTSENQNNKNQTKQKNPTNQNKSFSLSALDVKIKPEEGCLSTLTETFRLIDDK